MNLTRPSEVRALLAELDFTPSRVLGQNFLIDANILRIIVETANLEPGDIVLEVGPGLGVLTEALLQHAARVIAIEKDARLYACLSERFSGVPHLELRQADILEVDLDALLNEGVGKVVANLPYSIASRFLVNLFEAERAVKQIVVTVQKEVACRLASPPGSGDYGLLSILAQARYEVTRPKNISPTCFYPPPEITSSIVHLRVREQIPGRAQLLRLKALLKACFSARRKQLGTTLKAWLGANNLAPSLAEEFLNACAIEPRARPEELSPTKWLELETRLWLHPPREN